MKKKEKGENSSRRQENNPPTHLPVKAVVEELLAGGPGHLIRKVQISTFLNWGEVLASHVHLGGWVGGWLGELAFLCL